MAQISFRILGNPASSGGYTPLISKGEPLEADKVEIPYPNYTTDGECYGIKIYQDVVSYALYTNPSKVTSFDGNRSAALNIYLYIPNGYIVTLEGKEVSPKQILDRLTEEFYTQFMTMKGGYASATWSYKTQTIEEFSESKNLFVDIINEYTLKEKKQRSLVMNGETIANVIVSSKNNIAELMFDPYYEQLSSYDRLIIIENGESNVNTISLPIPRPKTYKVYVNGSYFCKIKSDTELITTKYQPGVYKIAENYSFTLQDLKKGKFADKVKIDDVNEIINCKVVEKDEVIQWTIIILVDGKRAEHGFKEHLYRCISFESSGVAKRINTSDKIDLVGAEINKKWRLKNIEQDGYDVRENKDELNKTITLLYTKKNVEPKTPAQTITPQGGSTITTIQKRESSCIKFILYDRNNEYSESEFVGTELIIESFGGQKIIIPFCLKPNKEKGINVFKEDVEVENFILDKIFNNRIQVKSTNCTFDCQKERKGRAIYLTPKDLPFIINIKKKRWFKILVILLLCLTSGAVGFGINKMLLQNMKETIIISDFNSKYEGYILNGKVFMNNGKSLGYILESKIYRSTNVNDEILGVYNHEGKMLTIENPNSKSVQNEPQSGTQREPDTPSAVTNPSQPENPVASAPDGQDTQRLRNESNDWLNKIKNGTITFDQIGQCTDWANKNPNAPDASRIKSYCVKINKVKEFILSITRNSGYEDVTNRANNLNSECFVEPIKDLKHYRVILQKFIPTEKNTKESIDYQIYNVGLKNENNDITSFSHI